jgi:hypothetical protein
MVNDAACCMLYVAVAHSMWHVNMNMLYADAAGKMQSRGGSQSESHKSLELGGAYVRPLVG